MGLQQPFGLQGAQELRLGLGMRDVGMIGRGFIQEVGGIAPDVTSPSDRGQRKHHLARLAQRRDRAGVLEGETRAELAGPWNALLHTLRLAPVNPNCDCADSDDDGDGQKHECGEHWRLQIDASGRRRAEQAKLLMAANAVAPKPQSPFLGTGLFSPERINRPLRSQGLEYQRHLACSKMRRCHAASPGKGRLGRQRPWGRSFHVPIWILRLSLPESRIGEGESL
jgi:hypothetical protein